MAWVGTNPVTVGDPTKKKAYDTLWDNVQFIRTNVMPAGTVMIFGQNSAPTGWTLKTDWTNNSMLVYTTDAAISGGGADVPYTAHNHKWLTHKATTHDETYNAAGTSTDIVTGAAGGFRCVGGATSLTAVAMLSSGWTSKDFSPLYQKVIAATKDAY